MSENIMKKKKIPFIYKLFSWLLIIITLFLLGSIMSLNILNIPLFILVLLIILLINSMSIFLMLKSKIKKIGFSFSLILILLFSTLIFYINKTTGLLNNLSLNYKTYNYSVVVLNKSYYEGLKDINNLDIGYYNDASVEVEKAQEKLAKKITFNAIGYEDNHTMANDLLDEDIDIILIEDSYLEILDENIIYNNKSFKENIKIIYNFNVITNTSDIAKDINVVKEPFNIYVSGIDTFGEISSVSRSDVNMVITVNPDTNKILLTSIPRDYYVQLHGKSGYKDKLTHAGLYGIDTSIQTIEDLLDTEINYYVKVNFTSVIDIITAIGGINVYSDYTFTSRDNYNYKKGYNKLNGEEALSFARERKAFKEGDRQRVKNQQAVFKAIFDKCTSTEIITKYSKLLDSLSGSFVTNMPTARITSLLRSQLAENFSWKIITNSLEGSDGSNYTYSAPTYTAYVMVPDEKSVLNARKLIGNVLNGEELENESTKVSQTAEDESSNITSSNFTAKLVRDNITLIEGEEYIYHGYTATYNGEDITKDNNLEEKFIINNKTFDDYRELVYYITYNLDDGNYTVTYNISYKGETKKLKQKITIKESNNYINDQNS